MISEVTERMGKQLDRAFIDVVYLGDGAYMGQSSGDVTIFTDDGYVARNPVVLGSRELAYMVVALQDWKFISR